MRRNFVQNIIRASIWSQSSRGKTIMASNTGKRVFFLRHGQAQHNPRAEKAKDEGCSHDLFMSLMKEDDAFDADLTHLGINQALEQKKKNEHRLQQVELIVSSPLSRAIKTADLTICPEKGLSNGRFPTRICVEHFREINGYLLNAKRRELKDLCERFHASWDFGLLSDVDETWTEVLESYEDCAERGYQGLLWLKDRPEHVLLCVAHGGILRFKRDHPLIKILDNRTEDDIRFGNCELREYEMSWKLEGENATEERPLIILTEVEVK